jgi:hypothetical protein
MVPGPFITNACEPKGTIGEEINRSTPEGMLPAPMLKMVGLCKLRLALITEVVLLAIDVTVQVLMPTDGL